jgi:hypothetical protein
MSGTASRGTLDALQIPPAISARVSNPIINLLLIENEIILLIIMTYLYSMLRLEEDVLQS